MARLGFGGFEVREGDFAFVADGFTDGSLAAVDTGIFRSGGAAAKINSGSGKSLGFNHGGVLNRTYRARIWFRLGASPSGTFSLIAFRDGVGSITGRAANAKIDSSRRIIGADGTLSAAVATNTFHCAELEVTANGTNHVWKVRLNGADVGASATTADGSTPVAVRFGNCDFFNNNNPDLYLDDWAINDDQGSVNNGFPGITEKIVLALPVADNAIGTNWVLGDTTTPSGNAFEALNNLPPVGVAEASATAGSQLRNSVSSTTAPASDYDVDVTDYTTLGVGASDSILAMRAVAYIGCNNTTAHIDIRLLSNPTDAGARDTTINSGTLGTFPSGWKYSPSNITEAPTVVNGTRPTVRVHRTSTSGFLYDACFTGAYIGYAPTPPVTVPLASASGLASASLALSAPTAIALGAASAASSASLALSAPTRVPLAASSAASSSSAQVDVPVPQILALSTVSAQSSALLALLTSFIPLDPAAAVSSASLSLKAKTVILLAPASGQSSALFAAYSPLLIFPVGFDVPVEFGIPSFGVPPADPRVEDDVLVTGALMVARRSFLEAQRRLPHIPVHRVLLAAHVGWFEGDRETGAVAVVRADGPLALAAHSTIRVSYGRRDLYAYVLRAETGGEDLALSRRAFLALASPADRVIRATVEVVG